MPNETLPPTTDANAQDSFLKTSVTVDSNNPYGDFFQETSDGNISIGTKVKKSELEIATGILGYIVPIAIVVAIIGIVHVLIRSQENNTFAENYSFICPYLNMGIDAPDKECKTLEMMEQDYISRTDRIKSEIIAGLSEYIPVKISKNIIDTSPERGFIEETFANKVHVDDIMKRFEEIRLSSVYQQTEERDRQNIICNGISITNGDTLSTQCTIKGGSIGSDNANNRLGSARIEALSFIEKLANTSQSQFIVLNPPTSLSVEEIRGGEDNNNVLFETQTTIQIQVRYVPFNQKP